MNKYDSVSTDNAIPESRIQETNQEQKIRWCENDVEMIEVTLKSFCILNNDCYDVIMIILCSREYSAIFFHVLGIATLSQKELIDWYRIPLLNHVQWKI